MIKFNRYQYILCLQLIQVKQTFNYITIIKSLFTRIVCIVRLILKVI